MPLSVIGAGFPRTGTASLKVALEQLGFGKCYHMSEVFPRPDHYPLWADAVDGKPVDWDKIFEDFGATTDAPACLFYKQLADHYPKAKVILSQRDPDRWFDSTQSTILSDAIMGKFRDMPPVLLNMMHKLGWHPEDPENHDKAKMIARLNAHNEEVKRIIPPERLLVFEASQGWEPLCAFLDLPVPDGPFPHVNSTDEFKKMLAQMSAENNQDLASATKILAEQAASQRTRPAS